MKNMYWFVLLLSSYIANATVHFNDGNSHDVSTAINDIVDIANDSFWGYPTTVNLLSGGNFESLTQIYNDSHLNLFGGTALSIFGNDNANVVIQSGNVIGSIYFQEYSKLAIYGGNFSLGQFKAMHHSTMDIYNGQFAFRNDAGLEIVDYSTVTIYGSDFFINGRPVQYGTYTTGSGTLTGILSGNDALVLPFSLDNMLGSAHLVLAPIPEPCTLLLLGLGGMMIRKKSKKNCIPGHIGYSIANEAQRCS